MTEEQFTDTNIRAKLIADASLDFGWNVGRALADFLPAEGAVLVMRSDDSLKNIMNAIMEGVRLQGRAVCDGGVQPKDSLGASAKGCLAAGSIFIEPEAGSDNGVIVELYDQATDRITSQLGLDEIEMMVEGGNMVPATIKGDLTYLA